MYYLSEYQMFDSTQELNHHVKLHTNRKYYDMNETQRNVLQFIAMYSVKFTGACHLKTETIAQGIAKSRRTVERAIKALIDLDVIDRIHTTRAKSGGKGANIYRVLPYSDVSEVSHCENTENPRPVTENKQVEREQSANSISHLKPTAAAETETGTTDVIKRGLKHAIPAQIYSAFEPFFNGEEIYDTYGLLLRAKAKIDGLIMLEDYSDRYVEAFYNAIRLYKAGKVRKLSGLLYVVWERLTAEISRQIKSGERTGVYA
ncbi:helix-turn-helix domain-containing protein [Oceanobacillus kimchii]|uniref:helix-turn-helix domain-containing protein n=1 Tax=Oceanobacillus kimchii TaxID=746691 RepID=UPI002331088E|nr:helix-turn-helix domain-containing protein [Oceanobacillus kimchii]